MSSSVLVTGTLLSGCGVGSVIPATSGISTSVQTGISGSIHGGQQPVGFTTIRLYAAGTTGDGNSAVQVAQTTSDANGNFNLPGSFACASTSPSQLYLTATGGKPIATSAANPNLSMMAVLGSCASLPANSSVNIDEVTTVAAVSALLSYMRSYATVASTSAHALALSSAFTLATQYANTATGIAPGLNVPSGATVPVAQINTLADVIAPCVNSTGGAAGDSTACGKLFSYTTPASGTAPTDTIQALIYLADSPTLNTSQIYGLITPSAPFQPALTAAPANFQVALSTAGGYDVILLVGQSNMVGYGTGPDSATDAAVSPLVYMSDSTGSGILPAQDPLVMLPPIPPIIPGIIGMGLTFGKSYAATLPGNRKLLLVGSAQGGTGFNTGAWLAPSGYLATTAVQRANAAMAAAGPGARFAGVLWHQGESDIGALSASTYQADLLGLFAYLRANITGAGPSTPFVVGEFNYPFTFDTFVSSPTYIGPELAVFRSLPDNLNNTAWVNAGGLASDTSTGEVHFSAISQRQLGRRYADRFFEASLGLPQAETSQEAWGGFFWDDGRSYVQSQPVNNLASVTGTVNIVTDLARGNVAQITAAGGYLSYLVPATTFNGDYTKMVWFNPGATGYFSNLISAKNTGQGHFLSAYENTNGTLGIYAGHSNGASVVINASATVTAPSGTWVNLALVYSASLKTMTIYVNGIPVSAATNIAAAPPLTGAPVPLYMGTYDQTTSTGVDGSMAGNRVWNVALTPQQIAALYTYQLNYRAGW